MSRWDDESTWAPDWIFIAIDGEGNELFQVPSVDRNPYGCTSIYTFRPFYHLTDTLWKFCGAEGTRHMDEQISKALCQA